MCLSWAAPETRTWVWVIYLRDNPRIHREKVNKWVKEEKKTNKGWEGNRGQAPLTLGSSERLYKSLSHQIIPQNYTQRGEDIWVLSTISHPSLSLRGCSWEQSLSGSSGLYTLGWSKGRGKENTLRQRATVSQGRKPLAWPRTVHRGWVTSRVGPRNMDFCCNLLLLL